MNCYDSSGRKLQLGARLGAGGEGAVYDLTGFTPPRVAKLYHAPPAQAKEEKLRAMVASAGAAMQNVAAWPLDTVHTTPHGPVAGIVMPKITGYKEIHLLYSPAHRRSEFPHADWGHLVQAARNAAAAVETVHAQGHVVGDVNQKNITVSRNATVMLVDCDSFQISRNGSIYPCEVGVAHFTPPELQGRPFRGVVRTPNHDAFGLAVLCFHLLFMGRHPFAGRFRGSGDMPIERAIREFRFSFCASAARMLMEPPRGALALSTLPPAVATMFELAFTEAGRNSRPSPAQWRTALDGLVRQLKTCAQFPVHKFYPASSSCTWCELEGRAGVIFFLGVPSATRVVFDLTAAWRAIEAVPPPAALPPLPQPVIRGIIPQTIDAALMLRRRAFLIARVVIPSALLALVFAVSLPWWVAALAIMLAFILPRPGRDEENRRAAAFEAAERAWKDVQRRWIQAAGADPFAREVGQLRRKRDEYRELERQHARERDALESAKRTMQLDRFLDGFYLDRATIPKIGPGRKATLASWGIETAADVTYAKLANVPGFGPTLVASLMMWRASLERKFTFDPAREIDAQELVRLDRRFAPQRRDLEQTLRSGPARLAQLREHLQSRHTQLRAELESCARTWAQARADLNQLRTWGRA